jgi:hypothetical protein
MTAENPTFRGAWASGTAYAYDDIVTLDGIEYVCVNLSGSTGNTPETDTGTNWAQVANDQSDAGAGLVKAFFPPAFLTGGEPAYEEGAVFFNKTTGKLIVGGATAWETVTSA